MLVGFLMKYFNYHMTYLPEPVMEHYPIKSVNVQLFAHLIIGYTGYFYFWAKYGAF